MTAPTARLASPARTGVWIGIAAIALMVAAFTGAMVVRRAQADWIHFRLPALVYVNTLVLLLSSATLERARAGTAPVARWLPVTLGLGLLFVAGQLVVWRNLAGQGLFLATSPSSAFFYVLTAVHGVHLLGGVAALTYVVGRLRRAPERAAGALDAAALYWHFMAVLWLYLLLLLTLQL